MAVNMAWGRNILLFLLLVFMMASNIYSLECYVCSDCKEKEGDKKDCAEPAAAKPFVERADEDTPAPAADAAGAAAGAASEKPANITAGGDWLCFTAKGKKDKKDMVWKGCSQKADTCTGVDSTGVDGFNCTTCATALCNANKGAYIKAAPLSYMALIAIIFSTISQY